MEDRKLDIVGVSDPFIKLLSRVTKVAQLNRPILLVGERGTGKRLLGERIHSLSRVGDGPFTKINCATFTEELLASELFGHEAGTFAGASRRYLGILERTNGGTVFLDGVDKTSLRLQEKLLRVIEFGEFQRVGGFDTIRTSVRIIASTDQDLPTLCQQGYFSYDLLDRLAFNVLTVPPLQARNGDVELLANHFAMQMTRELGRELFSGFSPSVLKKLISYSWPGNVRELRNVIERAVSYQESFEAEIKSIEIDPFKSSFRPVEITDETRETEIPTGPIQLKSAVSDYEKKIIIEALDRNKGNQTATAKELGLTYNQFRGIARKYSIKF